MFWIKIGGGEWGDTHSRRNVHHPPLFTALERPNSPSMWMYSLSEEQTKSLLFTGWFGESWWDLLGLLLVFLDLLPTQGQRSLGLSVSLWTPTQLQKAFWFKRHTIDEGKEFLCVFLCAVCYNRLTSLYAQRSRGTHFCASLKWPGPRFSGLGYRVPVCNPV